MEPQEAAVAIRREIARKGGFVLELVDDAYETRRLGTSPVVARFPESEEGTSAAYEDLALRARHEGRRLLLPRVLGTVVLIAGSLWICLTVTAQLFPYLFGAEQRKTALVRLLSTSPMLHAVSSIAYVVLVAGTLFLVMTFVIRNLRKTGSDT